MKKPKLIIHQPKIKGCDDSFFYEGLIAEKGKYKMYAVGEIRIDKNNELVYDNKERNNGFGFRVESDKDLMKVNEDNGFIWQMNNWFDVDEVAFYSYKEALNYLKSL